MFDKNNKLDTESIVRRWRLRNIKGKKTQSSIYAATPIEHLEYIRGFFAGASYTKFIDIGSGKGRTLIYFNELFDQLIGVEYSDELNRIAKDNIDKLSIKNISIIWEDAARYNIQTDNTVVYMFNPFGCDVLSKFLKLNEEHIKGNSILIVYVNPVCSYLLKDIGMTCIDSEYKNIEIWGNNQ